MEPRLHQDRPVMTMKTFAYTSLVSMALIASACGRGSESAPDGIFFPTVPELDAYPTALMTGTLELNEGCLIVRAGKERWLLLWPPSYSARTAQDGAIEILSEDGALVAATGRSISIGGGEMDSAELTGQAIPDRCGSHFWLVSPADVAPAARPKTIQDERGRRQGGGVR